MWTSRHSLNIAQFSETHVGKRKKIPITVCNFWKAMWIQNPHTNIKASCSKKTITSTATEINLLDQKIRQSSYDTSQRKTVQQYRTVSAATDSKKFMTAVSDDLPASTRRVSNDVLDLPSPAAGVRRTPPKTSNQNRFKPC